MRISHILAFAAVSTLSVSAFADTSGSITPASQAANTALANAAPHMMYRLSPTEAQEMRGTYQLDDGRLLVVTSKRSTVFAEFDGKREQLVPVSANRFVSRDTGAQLTFNSRPFPDRVTLDQVK